MDSVSNTVETQVVAQLQESGERTMSFGSVTVKVTLPSAEIRQRNIEEGQAALVRAKKVLVKHGVKIPRVKGKPLYFGSPDQPNIIIRELDGVRTPGKFIGGRFRPLPGTRANSAPA